MSQGVDCGLLAYIKLLCTIYTYQIRRIVCAV